MSSSYFQPFAQQTTPPKKPSLHHCNADRKNNPYRCIDEAQLNPLRRNLFCTHSLPFSTGLPVTTKSLR